VSIAFESWNPTAVEAQHSGGQTLRIEAQQKGYSMAKPLNRSDFPGRLVSEAKCLPVPRFSLSPIKI
ncbi:MAG: hypothetical protein K1X53_13190, partial [Candidatus Sumerlaeaceae bacterium]|nr:hypothetical protein [Candidatus Sumerlaeaceae bacterium]